MTTKNVYRAPILGKDYRSVEITTEGPITRSGVAPCLYVGAKRLDKEFPERHIFTGLPLPDDASTFVEWERGLKVVLNSDHRLIKFELHPKTLGCKLTGEILPVRDFNLGSDPLEPMAPAPSDTKVIEGEKGWIGSPEGYRYLLKISDFMSVKSDSEEPIEILTVTLRGEDSGRSRGFPFQRDPSYFDTSAEAFDGSPGSKWLALEPDSLLGYIKSTANHRDFCLYLKGDGEFNRLAFREEF